MTLSPADVIALHLADVTYPEAHPRAGAQGEVYAFVIRHGDGAILVDTGIGGGHDWIEAHFRPVRRPLAEALRARGVAMTTVARVLNTHLHFDHCGQNRLFPGVPLYVQRAELEAAREPGYPIREWVDFPGAVYVSLDGDAEIARGVRALATPGHTAGHQSVVVETSEGSVVIAGHAIYSLDEYVGRVPPEDTSAPTRASAERLRSLRPRRVLFSHDGRVWDDRAT